MKYIVKNCPSFNEGHPNLRFCGECLDLTQTDEYINDCCADRTDCLIKRVIDKCNEYKNIYGSPTSNMRFFAIEILNMFEIERVKK